MRRYCILSLCHKSQSEIWEAVKGLLYPPLCGLLGAIKLAE